MQHAPNPSERRTASKNIRAAPQCEVRVYYKQKFSDFVPPDMGCEQPRTEAEEITFSVMREMLYFDTRFERKNYCERYTRELESAAEAGCGYAWLLLGWFFSEQPSAFRCSTEVPTAEECFKKAELYYKKAVEAGENAARTLLGKLYIFGCGGSARVYSENRVEEGLEQLELAAEGGDASAAELLAAVYGNDVYDESPFDVQWMLEMGAAFSFPFFPCRELPLFFASTAQGLRFRQTQG